MGNTVSDNEEFGLRISNAENNTIAKNTIKKTEQIAGIYLINCTGDLITDNCITRNPNGIYIDDKTRDITIKNNDIAGNPFSGIVLYSNNPELIDARNNWWGDESGPFHPEKNPGGKGNNVSDGIRFKPWLMVSGLSREEDENESSYLAVQILMLTMGFLFILLAGVVKYLPDPVQTRNDNRDKFDNYREINQNTEETDLTAVENVTTCSGCGNVINKKKLNSIRTVCDNCGNEIVNPRFRHKK